ncbi:hypothetical protein [Vibrio cholerae]|uniref:hypothetical protein n=1 Tax=Vibrio cholerae TaxID=666 RepID=UPI00201B2515|nr:hypothetical protein [Vibrio cholerae]EGR2081491.1 TraR/DksA family transcriptional regulator [Vibrio cholerae]EJI2329179.1 hypothetical protein [Vibrio cholerae]ELK6274858.1 hypothetical protein [Vibrio cholerae]MCL5751754.1 hypothetical protein [Vibrio cholerae]
MSDWIDRSVMEQQAELERGIARARQTTVRSTQQKVDGVVVCACCLCPIPLGRLKIFPNATHCTECFD